MKSVLNQKVLWEHLNWQLGNSLYLDEKAEVFKQDLVDFFEIKKQPKQKLNFLKTPMDNPKSVIDRKKEILPDLKKQNREEILLKIKQNKQDLSCYSSIEKLYSMVSEQNLYIDKKILSPMEKGIKDIVVIALYPDLEDEEYALTGSQGELLSKMFKSIDQESLSCLKTTLIKSPQLERLSWRDLSSQIIFLKQELKLLSCKKNIILGDRLAQLILGTADSLADLRRKNLSKIDMQQIWVTDDLQMLINDPRRKKEAWLDLQWIQKQL